MSNFNKNKGIFLVISLLLLSILSGVSILLTKISIDQRKIFVSSVNQIKSNNTAKFANHIIDNQIDQYLNNLYKDTTYPNIAFVNNSTGTLQIVKNINIAKITDLNSFIFKAVTDLGTNTTTYSLIVAPEIKGIFKIDIGSPYTNASSSDTIFYDLKITTTICNTINGNNICDTNNLMVTKRKTFVPTNGQGKMQVLLNNQLPAGTSCAFPNMYVTCNDSIYPKTMADGSCMSNVMCNIANLPNCETCSTTINNTCTKCKANYYLSSNTCLACPTTGVASCPGTDGVTFFTCSSGYYRTATSTSCLQCDLQLGVVTCDPANGVATSCQAGYQLVNGSCNPCAPGTYNSTVGTSPCVSCSAGYYVTSSGQTSCNTPCSQLGVGVAGCSNIGVIQSCKTGYSLDSVNNSCIACPAGCDSCTSATNCSACRAGYYGSGGACTACAAGTYKDVAGNTACTTCASGTYTATTGQTACSSCSNLKANVASCTVTGGITGCIPGYQVNSYNTGCFICPIGTYKSITDTYCYICPSGTYNTATGQTACSSCSNLGANVSSCTATGSITGCIAGYELSNNQCIACAAGTYKASAGTGSCTSCASGTYTATTGQTACSSCSNLGANVLSCSTTGSITGCNAGYQLSNNQCIACSAGTYKSSAGTGSCISCASGTYTATSGQTVCSPCSNLGENINSCSTTGIITGCNPGYQFNNNTCDACPVGTYKDTTGNDLCINCTDGYYNTTIAQTSCSPCSNLGENINSCSTTGIITGCNPGYQVNNNMCNACPVGTYKDTTGNDLCINCTDGYYNTTTAQTSCTPCSNLGENINSCSTSGVITGCNPGYQFNNNMCNACSVGTYKYTSGNDLCINCTDGYYNTTTAQTSCTPCSNLGENINSCSTTGIITGCNPGCSLINGACILCPTGCDNCINATECSSCSAGYYGSGSSCISCDSGSYTKTSGQTRCSSCSTLGEGVVNCTLTGKITSCQTGYILVNGACTLCSTGCSSCSSATTCTSCSTGYSLISGKCCPTGCSGCSSATTCTSCSAGYSLISGKCCPTGCSGCSSATTCTSCSTGYSLISGKCCPTGCASCSSATSCTSCNAGYYLSGNSCKACFTGCSACSSATSCTSCNAGYYGSGSSCTVCVIGTYKSTSGNTSCTTCANGYYTSTTGQTACNPCSNLGTNISSCTTTGGISGCNAGYQLSNNQCVACGIGTYKATSGSGSCTSCASGYYNTSTAQTSCYSCSNLGLGVAACSTTGTITGCKSGYSLINGDCILCPAGCSSCSSSTSCTSCNTGYYLSSDICVPCDPGFYNATVECNGPYNSASSCKAGYHLYIDSNFGNKCVPCEVASYKPNIGPEVKCFVCPNGYYTDQTAQSQCKPCSNLVGIADCVTDEYDNLYPSNPQYTFYANRITQCKPGYYLGGSWSTYVFSNTIYPDCTACQESCATCTGEFNCTSCKPGFTLKTYDFNAMYGSGGVVITCE